MNEKDRFYGHKWGVFNHYLAVLQNDPRCVNSYGKQTGWDTLVNEFDVDLVAKTLHEIGAKYYVITVMQGTKYMIAPNATFDKIAGTKPGEACSTRDLIAELYEALSIGVGIQALNKLNFQHLAYIHKRTHYIYINTCINIYWLEE